MRRSVSTGLGFLVRLKYLISTDAAYHQQQHGLASLWCHRGKAFACTLKMNGSNPCWWLEALSYLNLDVWHDAGEVKLAELDGLTTIDLKGAIWDLFLLINTVEVMVIIAFFFTLERGMLPRRPSTA